MKFYPPGTRIAGCYEIASRPLMGGMGIVYLCFDHQAQRPVALKTFKPQYLPNRAARDRFLREGTAWVDLGRHPHVVRCYRVLHLDPEVYLVLELVAKEEGREISRLRIFALIPHFMRGTHVDKPPVTMLRCKRALVTCDSGLAVHVDGEIYAKATSRLEIEILPQRLRIVCGSADGSYTIELRLIKGTVTAPT